MKPILLITGASGNLGKIVLNSIPSSYRILSVSRRSVIPQDDKDITSINADLLNQELIFSKLSDFSSISTVVHVAGITGTNGSSFDDNITMTQNIVKLAIEKHVKHLIFISSNSVNYSDRHYAMSKKKAEQLIIESGLEYTIIRPTLLLGDNSPEIKLLGKFVKSFPILPLVDNGSQKIQPIQPIDVAKLINLCLKSKKSINKIYSIGGPRVISSRDLADSIQKQLGTNKTYLNIPLKFFLFILKFLKIMGLKNLQSNLLPLTKDLMVDNTQATNDLGWEPTSSDQI